MGQAHSRHLSDSSTASDTPLNRIITVEKAQSAPHSNAQPVSSSREIDHDVTRPAPPPRIHRISQLMDLDAVLDETADEIGISPPPTSPGASDTPDTNKRPPKLVESPSGKKIGRQELLAYPDRPLTMRERQDRIKLALETTTSNGSAGSGAGLSANGSTGSPKKGSAGQAAGLMAGWAGGKKLKKEQEHEAPVGHVRHASHSSTRA
jgi:hypothetical protein